MFEDMKAYGDRPPAELMPGITFAADVLTDAAIRAHDLGDERAAKGLSDASKALSTWIEDRMLAEVTATFEAGEAWSPRTYEAGFETGLLVAIDALQEHGRDIEDSERMFEAQDVLIDVWPVYLDIGVPSLAEMREAFQTAIDGEEL